ncbi:Piwi-domain-containing protein [Mytilinidion resinicola]|uniref:Piwi-domain-containing protein n=1 Tax=Mytilinidion resinicola TaxID=574789 RepID=A0A6A6Z5F1_9PEZI|nr:Piwi-domain-containing protein [Mytilinidion resinicola]KAF2815524.1 Piwi-domain-containing protein [Mytilinidion resinicola]
MGWAVARGVELQSTCPPRPKKASTLGREIAVTLNTYNLFGMPTKTAYQYDITIVSQNPAKGTTATDPPKRGLVKKIWESKAVKQELGDGHMWLHDGNKLAWSSFKLPRPEHRIQVDLDQEEGRANVKKGKENRHKIFVRFTKDVDFSGLQAFFEGQAPWSEACIDTINFFDHAMRENPSHRYTQIKKNFFQRGEKRFALGKGIEAFKGVFSSIRPSLFANGVRGLSVNVDVANGTFWIAQDLGKALLDAFGCSQVAQLQQKFAQAKAGKEGFDGSLFRRDLKRFSKLHVVDTHRSEVGQWCIDKFIAQDCTEKKFQLGDKNGEKGEWITIFDYFKKTYNITCTRGIPLVKMTKGKETYLPVDVLRIEANQRYNSKLDEGQTSNMIKFAVTYPKERWAAVEAGVKLLDWQNDPYLAHYNVKINPHPVEVKARLLPCPDVTMTGGSIKAGAGPAKGRWRIDKMKFLTPNTQPLRSWGICVIGGPRSLPPDAAKKFAQLLITTYKGHGGKFGQGGEDPWIGPGNLAQGGEMINSVWQATGNKFTARPQLLVFIVNDKNIDVYRRIKKSCDCRFGVVSQVLQSAQCVKLDSQYASNVCMKINAKLGGSTSRATGTALARVNPKFATTSMMCVGADVSHPAPGSGSSEAASFAAITVSQDSHFARYTAECNTNGRRLEMITTQNIDTHFKNQAKTWIMNCGKGNPPKRILYVRDGVSEGQYQYVLEQEVKDMKAVMKEVAPGSDCKFTVVIAGKRHHIRFFPKAGTGDQRTGNAMPGTLVENGCTHPFEWDFYLCAHAAIKGTARPIHYQVILNEGDFGGEELQQFIFEQSFQYARSTTPVSLFPAVYYAHLAADRARAHENTTPVSSGKKGDKKGEDGKTETSGSSNTGKPSTEVNPLVPLNISGGIQNVMWFI